MRAEKGVKFAMVPPRIFTDGSSAAMRVWCGLCMFANHDNVCWPTQRQIGEVIDASQVLVSRGLRELRQMKMVTDETGPAGRKFIRLHMNGYSTLNKEYSEMNTEYSGLNNEYSTLNTFSGQKTPQSLVGIEEAPKRASAIDPLTRSTNQIHEPDAAAAGETSGKATATAGLSRFDEYWAIVPKVLATNRDAVATEWRSLAPADHGLAIAGMRRYAAVFAAAPDDRKQYFVRAARFLRERMWTMTDNEWRILARVEIPAEVADNRPADFW